MAASQADACVQLVDGGDRDPPAQRIEEHVPGRVHDEHDEAWEHDETDHGGGERQPRMAGEVRCAGAEQQDRQEVTDGGEVAGHQQARSAARA